MYSNASNLLWPVLLTALLAPMALQGRAQEQMPRADVIDVPAVGEGLCVHNLFQSNMVVQRDKPIPVWGWAAPGETVTVAFGGAERTAAASGKRRWQVSLPAMQASTAPQSMVVRGTETTLTLDNVLIGDVWILGGQSNMEFPLARTDSGDLEIVSARYNGIRILTVPAQNGPETKVGFPRLHEWSDWWSRHFRKGDWDVCSPEIARELSAIGYVFARRIHMASQVPIGVIDMSRGGTAVETWTPEPVLRGIQTNEVQSMLADWDRRVATWDAAADLEQRVAQHKQRVANRKKQGQEIPADWKEPSDLRPGPSTDMNRPSNCYRSMLAPIAGLAVKGAIFHQGYNNAIGGSTRGAAMYYQIFGKMITAWREAFGDPELPFGIIALCTDGQRQNAQNYAETMLDTGVYIREVQYRTFLDQLEAGDTNIGFASSFDKRRSWYHPQLKVPVGERIARWALATEYGFQREIRWKPPMLKTMQVEESRIVLHLDRPVAAEDNKAPITGFAIAGTDRRFQPANVQWLETGKDEQNRPQFDRRALVLSHPLVPTPIHYRYAWGRNPMANLQSSDHTDLPFATQRSDDWPMEQVPAGVVDPESIQNGTLSRAQRNKLRDALREDDLRRRLYEARELLREHGEGSDKER